VVDLVDGVAALMETAYHRPVNLGNPEEYTMLELARAVQEALGVNADLEFRPLPSDDPRQRRPDISVAKELLGWSPRVGLREGLRRAIDSFRRELFDGRAAAAAAEVCR
jgi:nucleoside-diphosphate-sugar epimerase